MPIRCLSTALRITAYAISLRLTWAAAMTSSTSSSFRTGSTLASQYRPFRSKCVAAYASSVPRFA
eukprot:2471920-Rhodomonas_salina.2